MGAGRCTYPDLVSRTLSSLDDVLRSVLCVEGAEALDAGQDVTGRPGPFERLRIGVVLRDEDCNSVVKGAHTAVDAAPDLLFGQECEEAFDLVDPGRTGRRQVHMPARPACQPGADQWGLVRGV